MYWLVCVERVSALNKKYLECALWIVSYGSNRLLFSVCSHHYASLPAFVRLQFQTIVIYDSTTSYTLKSQQVEGYNHGLYYPLFSSIEFCMKSLTYPMALRLLCSNSYAYGSILGKCLIAWLALFIIEESSLCLLAMSLQSACDSLKRFECLALKYI